MANQRQPQPCLIEVLDAAPASSGGGVLARLAEREEQRAATTAKRLQELQVNADPRESTDAFLEEFAVRRQQVEAELQAAAASPGGGAAELAALAKRIADLEKAVADATYFLPAYDLRQATLALAALREQQEAAAAAVQPRKRFAFNRKAAAAATAAPAASAGTRSVQPDAVAGRAPGSSVDDVKVTEAIASAQLQQLHQQQQQVDVHPQQAHQTQQQGGNTFNQHSNGSGSESGSTISCLRGRVLAVPREEASGKEFTLSDLEDCTIYLLAPLAALFLHGLRRCRIFTGPVAGSCFVEDATNSLLMIAARQVRIHSAESTDFYLRVRSHPIIEHSSGVRFAPYSPAYPGAHEDLEKQGLAEDADDMWRQVNDFGWLRATPSPNWSVVPEDERSAAPAAAEHAACGGSGT